MKMKIHTFTDSEDNFIITSPTYKTMMQSTLPAFIKLMHGCGEYNKKDDVFQVYGGGKVYCRTETDPDSVVGITNVRHIWGDEAGKYRLYFWENLQARADFYGCGIDLTTSPYALNWIYKQLIKPHKQGQRPDLEYIHAASWENPLHSLADEKARAQKRATMDPRRFDMIYGGQWERAEGLVYDCWSDTENYVEAHQLPLDTVYYAGVDWGYNHPFVIKIRAITPNGRHIGVSEFYKTNVGITDMILIAKQKHQVWGTKMFWCDPSRPEYIQAFNEAGIPAGGAENAIQKGIDLHYQLIRTRQYTEFMGACPHSADERETYHYPEPKDLRPDQNDKEILPVDQGNHCMDVDRYLTLMTHRSGIKLVPKVPGADVTYKTKLERIKKRRPRFADSEDI